MTVPFSVNLRLYGEHIKESDTSTIEKAIDALCWQFVDSFEDNLYGWVTRAEYKTVVQSEGWIRDKDVP